MWFTLHQAGMERKFFLLKKRGVGCRIVRPNHIDRVSVIHIRFFKAVCDIGFCLAVSADVGHLKIQQIIVAFKQWLIGGTEEIVRSIVKIEPDLTGEVSSSSWCATGA